MAPQPAALVALVVALLSHPVLAQQAPPAVRDLNPGKPVKDHLQPFTPWAKMSRLAPSDSHTREQCADPQRAALMVLLLAFFSTPAMAQEGPQVVRDLNPMTPRKLAKEDLQQLMPGAKLSRVATSGNTHIWTNDPDGTFIVSSDNRNTPGGNSLTGARASTTRGKWHVSDDGRYCVLIDWKSTPTEEWCRYFFVVPDGSYYATKSDQNPTEKVYKFQVSK